MFPLIMPCFESDCKCDIESITSFNNCYSLCDNKDVQKRVHTYLQLLYILI